MSNIKFARPHRPSVEELAQGVLAGNRALLGRAITLIESNAVRDQESSRALISRLLPHSGNAVRIGITGVPGAGKSSFIEAFGTYLCKKGFKVAVLAIDPSSSVSRGSIMGDKTRMEELSGEENAFIRPSPSGGSLGGVARKTRETMIACEAAGFDIILIETVGVGQSETTVRSMVDIFMLLLITGAGTIRRYPAGAQTETAHPERFGDGYYDRFNTAVGLDSAGRMQLHHKGRLVIGVENTPTWVFDAMKFLVIDLGGTVGQIGKGLHGTAFEHNGVKTGPAICYEGLYGDFYGGFVRRGAQFMAIISNDGWWGDTPGYKHLFSISRLRAVEHRRAIARSANTGKSGFISARGDVGQTLGWEQRGVITAEVPLNSELTFYTRYGDCLARISEYILLLSVLYYVAYRYKRRNHLVK